MDCQNNQPVFFKETHSLMPFHLTRNLAQTLGTVVHLQFLDIHSGKLT